MSPPTEGASLAFSWRVWLDGLKAPAGICCTSDPLARRLLVALNELGIRVPERMAVVGVGDSAIDNALAGLGISSVMLPGRRIGLRAAARLPKAVLPRPYLRNVWACRGGLLSCASGAC